MFIILDLVNGEWSPWQSWEACTADQCETSGTTTRYRLCDNPPQENAGLPCPDVNQQTLLCYNHTRCPIHGQWSQWTEWTTCSTTCAPTTATKTSNRDCTDPAPDFGGNDCAGTTTSEVANCVVDFCPSTNTLNMHVLIGWLKLCFHQTAFKPEENKDNTVAQDLAKVFENECDDASAINFWLGPEDNSPLGFFRLDLGGVITIVQVLLKNSHNGANQNRWDFKRIEHSSP